MHRLFSIAVPVLLATGHVPTIPTLLASAPHSSGIVAADDGTLYFVDAFQSAVWRARPGEAPQIFISGRGSRSLQLDAAGHLYGAHDDGSGMAVLWRADAAGAVIELTRTPRRVDDPHSFVVLESGEVVRWVGARRAPITSAAQTADGGFVVTSGSSVLRVSQSGRTTTLAGDDPLLRPRTTVFSRLFGDPGMHLTGIAVSSAGDIYVANAARGTLVRIDARGRAVEAYAAERGWRPTGVAAAHDAIYVLEYGNGVRVRRIDADGSNRMIAVVRPPRTVAAESGTPRFVL